MRHILVIAAVGLYFKSIAATAGSLDTMDRTSILNNLDLLTKENLKSSGKPKANNFEHWCNAFVTKDIADPALAIDKDLQYEIRAHCTAILRYRLGNLSLAEMIELKSKGLLTEQVASDLSVATRYHPSYDCAKIVNLVENGGMNDAILSIFKEKCRLYFPLPSLDEFDDQKFSNIELRPLRLAEINASKPVLVYDHSSWCRPALIRLNSYPQEIQDALLAKCIAFQKCLDERKNLEIKGLTITDEMVQSSSEKGGWCNELLYIGKANLNVDNPQVWDSIVKRCGADEFYKLDGRYVKPIQLDVEIIQNSSNLDDDDEHHWCFGIKSKHFVHSKITDAAIVAEIKKKCTENVFKKLDNYTLEELKELGENIPNILINNSKIYNSEPDHWCFRLRQIGVSKETFIKVKEVCGAEFFNLDKITVEDIEKSKINLTLLALSGTNFCTENDKRAAIKESLDLVEKKCNPVPSNLNGLSADDIFLHHRSINTMTIELSDEYDGKPSHWCNFKKELDLFLDPFDALISEKCKVLFEKIKAEKDKAKEQAELEKSKKVAEEDKEPPKVEKSTQIVENPGSGDDKSSEEPTPTDDTLNQKPSSGPTNLPGPSTESLQSSSPDSSNSPSDAPGTSQPTSADKNKRKSDSSASITKVGTLLIALTLAALQ